MLWESLAKPTDSSLPSITLLDLLPVSIELGSLFVRADTKCNIDLIFIFFLIDRVGRKGPLIFGTITITILLIIEAALGSRDLESNQAMSRAGVAMIFLVSIVFSWSFGPVSWTYMSEVMVSSKSCSSFEFEAATDVRKTPAYANSCQRKRFRYWYRKLAHKRHFLPSIPSGVGKPWLEVLFRLRCLQ